MKVLICSVLTVSSILAFANDAAPTEQKKSNREAFEARRYRHTGGLLRQPGSGVGCLSYVNTTESVPQEWVVEKAKTFQRVTKIVANATKGTFEFPNPKIDGNASLYIVDDPKLPTVLSAPDNRWAMVNVAQLKSGRGSEPAFFEARVKKEITRGIALLAGAQSSNYPGSLMGVMDSPEKLDTYADASLPVDIPARFHDYTAGYGITPIVFIPYIKACREGWAPQPTNEIQKAIWDKVHELPTNPIKIKPETKKVTE